MVFVVKRRLTRMHTLAMAAFGLGLGIAMPAMSVQAEAAQFQHTPRVINTLSSTYGFVIAQDITLAHIAERFPNLQGAVTHAAAAFDNAFPNIDERLASNLATLMGKQPAREMLDRIRQQMDEVLREQLTPEKLTSEFAARFLQAIRLRAQGDYLPSPFKEYLLATKYQLEPVYELFDGYYQTFHSKEHAKSLGVNLALRLPASWSASESPLSHIVQRWQSQDGTGTDVISLEIYDLHGQTVTDGQLETMADTDQLRQWVPAKGEMLDSGLVMIDHRQAYWFDFARTQQQQDTPVSSYTREYGIFLDDTLLRLHCTSYHPAADASSYTEANVDLDINDGFGEMKPMCDGVMNSLVVMADY